MKCEWADFWPVDVVYANLVRLLSRLLRGEESGKDERAGSPHVAIVAGTEKPTWGSPGNVWDVRIRVFDGNAAPSGTLSTRQHPRHFLLHRGH